MSNQIKTFALIGVVILVLVVAFFVGGKNGKEEEIEYVKGTHYIELSIKDYGTIEAELYADIAPITVTNFLNLVHEGFYDGLTFHRIIEGFMMQGGDPTQGNKTPKEAKTIKGEFSSNGVENSISHTKGTLSMARSVYNDSASSQFFIMHEDNRRLDGDYAAFGRVTKGLEIVDEICKNAKVEDDDGTVLYENQPVIEKIVEVSKPKE
ncbi:MAG: peptidylprolyl isomerase [Bacilli bacterium]|nr:peptidylprolyl isomerase [Bacilli bacterium]